MLGNNSACPLQIGPEHSQGNAEIGPLAVPFAVHDAIGDLEIGRLSTELFSHTQPSTVKGDSPFIIHVRKLGKSAQSESFDNAAFTLSGAA
jgi:hypothetical protein